ncbi:MAG: 16S rRNA (guanine(527)-N(7))-methyltransferase RsmG [Flavobacterium sp.]|jgi:16S rRNA (guanine527-N7)-methyltransferase
MNQIQKYFSDLTNKQIEQFTQLESLYNEWNAKINVISRKDIESLYTHHVLHSLGIAKVIEFKPNTKIMDVGTGGGFPGIPLAIMFPESQFYLIDTIGKKIKVVQEIAQALGLKNLKAEQKKAENVKETFDFVVSRAVTAMPDFANWVKNNFNIKDNNKLPNGILYLKGGDLKEELKDFNNYKEFFLKDFFTEDFFETKKVIHIPM